MPTICLRCKKRLEAVPGLAPRCPECGGTRFSFVSAKKAEELSAEPTEVQQAEETAEVETDHPVGQQVIIAPAAPEQEPLTADSVESIRILEPGKYDLNLLKLAESDDRVILMGKDGNYRLDLSSMVRSKKKR